MSEQEAIDTLKEMQWSRTNVLNEDICPNCCGTHNKEGHSKTCRLAKAIALLEQAQPKNKAKDERIIALEDDMMRMNDQCVEIRRAQAERIAELEKILGLALHHIGRCWCASYGMKKGTCVTCKVEQALKGEKP